jgi:hypothetical protein
MKRSESKPGRSHAGLAAALIAGAALAALVSCGGGWLGDPPPPPRRLKPRRLKSGMPPGMWSR